MNAKNIKALFIGNSLGGGGAERVLVTIASYLADKGYDCTYLALNNAKNKYEYSKNLQIIQEDTSYNKFYRFFSRINVIKKTVKKKHYDVVISFCNYNNVATLINRKRIKGRIIISERNDPKEIEKNKLAFYLRKKYYKYTNLLVCQTEEALAYFKNDVKNLTIVHNPVNDIVKTINRSSTIEKRFVSFCRLEPQKNLQMMILAFKEFCKLKNDYVLDIYGVGSQYDNLQNLIEQYNLKGKVNLKGFSNNVHELIKNSTAFLLSSNYEGISNSLIEAMAIGLPCIATDCPCGGSREMIKDGVNGFLVEVGNYKQMCEKMVTLVKNPELLNQISFEAKKISLKLDINEIGKVWEKIIFGNNEVE